MVRIFVPEKTLDEYAVGEYRVILRSGSYYDGEQGAQRFVVALYNGFKVVEQASLPAVETARKLFRYWTEEMLPVQLAKEMHGLANPLKSIRISEAPLTKQA